MVEIDDVRKLTDGELTDELHDIQRELMHLRFRVATMQLPNVNELRKARKRIAKIKTVIRERELAKST